ncbi:NAD-dependent epimerase/dehydratase family protein [bacterium]|nr:NAD-dependent epimerase/dehydratase family protein [bacterium]
MKALVTGATGFIGSHLVNSLLNKGFDVTITARESSNTACLPCDRIKINYCDICLPELLHGELADIEYIFHLAGLTKTRDPRKFMKVNAEATARLLALCAKECKNLKRFVYVGSLAAIGPSHGTPLTEDTQPAPITDYGMSKLEGEKFTRTFMNMIPVTIIHPPAVFGPGERDLFIYFKMINRRIKPYVGNPDRKIALVYIKDLTDLLLHVIKKDEAIGKTYFVAVEPIPTLRYFADTIAEASGKKCFTVHVPGSFLYPAAIMNAISSFFTGKPPVINFQKIRELLSEWDYSSDKVKRELDFKPQYSLKDGVKETWDWYKKNGWL